MKRLYFISLFVLAILAIFVTCKDNGAGGENPHYTVTFDKNHDSFGEDYIHHEIKVPHGAMVEDKHWPSDPTLDGHVFDGWHTHRDGSELGEKFHHRYKYPYPVTDHITLYAQWRQIVTVTVKLEIQGNEDGDSITLSTDSLQDQVEIQDIEEGKIITISYTLAQSEFNINRLAFSGVKSAIDPVTSADSGKGSTP